jgi:ATP synthase F0 subunit b
MVGSFPVLSHEALQANPSALHKEGVALKRALSEARTLAAKAIGAHSDEIVFTSNATESDNLAILGSVKYFLQHGITPQEIGIYVSPFEHAAVSESLASLHPDIFVCTLLHEEGYLMTKKIVLQEGLKAVLISVMMVQNEIGTVQDIKELAKQVRKLRKEHPTVEIRLHTDATQAPLSKLMAERSAKISKGIDDAKKNKETLENTKIEYEETIAEAKKEANKIFQEGKKEAETKKMSMIEDAKKEVATIIENGKKSLEAEKAKIMEDAKKEIVSLTMLATEKMISNKPDVNNL